LNTCKHEAFNCDVTVNRLDDSGQFNAEVRIVCEDCQTPFRFIGLPYGLDLNGAAVSPDGTEGRFAIAPKGEAIALTDPKSVGGFTIRKPA
jgi:hypothetical protein